MRTSGIGGSLFLIALGAILYWAVSFDTEGVNLDMVGLILLGVGAIGLVLTLLMTADHDRHAHDDVTVVER